MERRLLVVDDEASIRDLFESLFSDAGYAVYAAENADQALAIVTNSKIDLIFLDLKLFGMNGIELCRKMKANNPIAIIHAITGWTGLFEVEECREAGFDDFFTKPVQLDLLLRAAADAYEKIDRWRKRFPDR